MPPDLLRLYDIYADCPWCGHSGCVSGKALAGRSMGLNTALSRFRCSVCRRRGRPKISITKPNHRNGVGSGDLGDSSRRDILRTLRVAGFLVAFFATGGQSLIVKSYQEGLAMAAKAKSVWEQILDKRKLVEELEASYKIVYARCNADNDISDDEQKELDQVMNGIQTAKGKVKVLEDEFKKIKKEWEGLNGARKDLLERLKKLKKSQSPLVSKVAKELKVIDRNAGLQRFKDAINQFRECQSEVNPVYGEYTQLKLEWERCAPRLDTLQGKIDELEAANHEHTGAHKKNAQEVTNAVDDERWEHACNALFDAEEMIENDYAEYLKKTYEPKPRFEMEIAEFKQRIDLHENSDYKSIQKRAQEISAGLSIPMGLAESLDYKGALESIAKFKFDDKLDELDQRASKVAADAAEASRAWTEIRPRLNCVSEGDDLDIPKASIDKLLWGKEHIPPMFTEEKFEEALEHISDVEATLEVYEAEFEQAQKRQEFLDLVAKSNVDQRLAQARREPNYPEIEEQHLAATSAADKMEKSANDKKWDEAIQDASNADVDLKVYEDALKDLLDTKSDYEEGVAKMEKIIYDPMHEEISEEPEVAKLLKELDEIKLEMKKYESERRFYRAREILTDAFHKSQDINKESHKVLEKYYPNTRNFVIDEIKDELSKAHRCTNSGLILFGDSAGPIISKYKPDYEGYFTGAKRTMELGSVIGGCFDSRIGSAFKGVALLIKVGGDANAYATDQWEKLAGETLSNVKRDALNAISKLGIDDKAAAFADAERSKSIDTWNKMTLHFVGGREEKGKARLILGLEKLVEQTLINSVEKNCKNNLRKLLGSVQKSS